VREGHPAGTVVQAGQQSAGRGQYERTFSSPPGGLYFSLILRPVLEVQHLPLVTLATGLACCQEIEAKFELQPLIKWPNDLYIIDRKVAGILCERPASDPSDPLPSGVIIGVGLNINSEVDDFPVALRPLLTTIYTLTGKKIDLTPLLADVLAAITVAVASLSKDPRSLLRQWQRYDYLLNRNIVHTAGEAILRGVGLGVDHRGWYRLRDAHGEEHSIVGGQLRPE
jgi:BirA family transcriptional regulator, biotin operon repressor / biotin---[acetyl-CoA-carboxylase] ligase